MKNMRLTKAGAELLGTAHADGETRFWIGYYGLAYVADRETDSISEAASTNTLTKKGDYIYNIWQGDMLNGYAQDNPDDTAAASLFGLTLYDKSIRTNYRYVYDKDTGRNRLVAWKSVQTGSGENTLERKGAAIYYGADLTNESKIPLPAPLYYGGDPDDSAIVNESDVDTDVQVSADYRYYVGTRDSGPYGWLDSSATQDEETVTDATLLSSISNFNRFHGTVSSEGYGVSSVSSCHNMSKATKLFPISYYSVVNDNGKKVAETSYGDNSPARKPLASAIKFRIDLSPVTADAGYTALNYEAGDDLDDQAVEDASLYSSKYVSFRFNRIGIYAVPMTVHRYSTDSSTDTCNLQKVQFEINGDEEPVLFAVADVNDVIISDNPSSEEGGVAKFSLDFILHIGNGDEETAVEQRTAVYYNLYENDATTWYKNQLLASAGISEAVTNLSLDVNSLKQQVSDSSGKECCSQETDLARYALKNHTHDYMKNLVDGNGPGAVRGIDTCDEGDGSYIKSLFGLEGNAPEGTQVYCSLDALAEYVDGAVVSIPDSYAYCVGPVDLEHVPVNGLVTLGQLKAIMKNKGGVAWIVANMAANCGWFAPGDTQPRDPDHLYIWISDFQYAKIDCTTGEIVVNTANAGDTSMFQGIVLQDASSEPMFSDGYAVGHDSLVLGDNTAASGDCSIVQGKDVYTDGDYVAIVASDTVKLSSSDHVAVEGASGIIVKNSKHSVIFANSADGAELPAEISGAENSVVGGDFNDDGSHGFANGIKGSMWLMHAESQDRYGAAGSVSGSVLTGGAYFGGSIVGDAGKSVENSLLMQYGAGKGTYGSMTGSAMLGDGSSKYDDGTGDSELDKDISLKSSLVLGANLHGYYTDSEAVYREATDSVYSAPSITRSVVVNANVRKPVSESLIISGGELDVASFSVNSRHEGFGGYRNVIMASSSRIGRDVTGSVMVGTGCTLPDGTHSFLSVGDNTSVQEWFNDTVIKISDFNAKVSAGTIEDGNYVIVGDGSLIVWDSVRSVFDNVILSGEADHMYYGVSVTSGHPVYNTECSDSYTVWFDGRPATGTSFTTTVSLGTAKNNRVNPGSILGGLNVGDGNTVGCPDTDTRSLLLVGDENNTSFCGLSNVSVIGNGNTFNTELRPYGSDAGSPLYPTMSNVHMFGDDYSLHLGSLEPYATHRFDDALVFLDGRYGLDTLGIFTSPMKYYSKPDDSMPSRYWAIDYADQANAGAFSLDPNLFSNYGDAWAALTLDVDGDASIGTAVWQAYRTSRNPADPSTTSVTWSQVTQYAEAHQSESDTYAGPANGDAIGNPDPFVGMTRAAIRGMIGKPDAPMIYTGGLTLAGKPTGTGADNVGLLKLGHVSKPVAYLSANPVSAWNPVGGRIAPISITGTTVCPYAGMSLTIDGTQELDGTMHLVLSNGGSGVGNAVFSEKNINAWSEDKTEMMASGKYYNVTGNGGRTVEFDISQMDLGGESIVINTSNRQITIKVDGLALTSTPCLVRRTSYIRSGSTEPQNMVLLLPCSTTARE